MATHDSVRVLSAAGLSTAAASVRADGFLPQGRTPRLVGFPAGHDERRDTGELDHDRSCSRASSGSRRYTPAASFTFTYGAEVDLHLRARLAVGHRHRDLAPTV